MSRDVRFVYSETSTPQWWILALIWGACLLPVLFVTGEIVQTVLGAGWPALLTTDGYAMMAVDGVCLLVPALIHIFFGKLTIGVSEVDTEVVAAFGAGWIHKHIRFDQIIDVTDTQYRPIMEFGGWGIRGLGKKRAWTISGDRAVVLELRDGGLLYLGSDTPKRLRERIQTSMKKYSAEVAF